MDNYKAVFDVTNMDKHWTFVRDAMESVFKADYIIAYNQFARHSEALYKEWNEEYEKYSDILAYEPYIAERMQQWLDEHVNNPIKGERLITYHADREDAQIYGVHNEYPDVTIRMHLEKI